MTTRAEKQALAREAHIRAHNKQKADLAGMGLFAKFSPSDMQAGPCPRAASYKGRVFLPSEMEITPFPDCTHPDQCGCMYQAKLGREGEF